MIERAIKGAVSRRAVLLRIGATTLVGAAAAVGCSRHVSGGSAGKIRINTAGVTGEGGLFLAQDRGYFAAEGVQVELIPAALNSSADTLTQLAGGDLDLATFSPTAALFNALNRGVDVVGLMPLNTVTASDHSTGIVVRQDLVDSGRYRHPVDLKGMKVAVLTVGGIGNYHLFKALQSANLMPAAVTLTTLAFPDCVVALANGSIDAAHEAEPFITLCEARRTASLMIPASATGLGVPSAVLFAAGPFVREQRVTVQRFLTALLRGQRDYVAGVTSGVRREEMLESLRRHTSIKDRDLLARIRLPSVDTTGSLNTASLTALQQYFLGLGLQKIVLPPERVFDRSYVQDALRASAART
jgi:NitT/TauT family transport system substrate-binding protein